MNKMNKQDVLKVQPIVLRVDIQCDCEGCHHKVKKTLQKIDGVHKVSLDQGKVTVLGNVDPATLIKKLEKTGKHAELLGGQKGQFPNMNNNQFKNMLMEKAIGGKGGKPEKGGKPQQQGGFVIPQQMNQNKGAKFVGNDQKKYKPLLPEEDEDDDFDDEFDDDDDEFDDDDVSEDSFDDGHKPPIKLPTAPRGGGGHGPQGNNVTLNGLVKDNNGGKGKKGGGLDLFLKGMLGKASGKKGKQEKSKGKNQDSGKNGGGVAKGDGKNGDQKGKKGNSHGDGGKDNSSMSKKGGKNPDPVTKLDNIPQGFNLNHNLPGVGNMGGLPSQKGNMGNFPMGQMGNFRGAPPPGGMNPGHFQGVGQGYPYDQQYNSPWMMNQQMGNGQSMYHPMMHMRPPPAQSYGPPPGSERYTHMFNDEDANSCSIM